LQTDCGVEMWAWLLIWVAGIGVVDVMILYPATSTRNHSTSDCCGNWTTSVHFNCSNVERPCFLLRTEPPREKVGSTSLSSVVQYNEFPEGRWWVPCSRRLAGPRCRPCFFWAPRCSAIVCKIFSRFRQQGCCRALKRAYSYPAHIAHIQHR